MSWLARSLANSLRLDKDEDDDDDDDDNSEKDVVPHHDNPQSSTPRHETRENIQLSSPEEEEDQPRGVKEDLTELGQTLTRQFWGVTNFLTSPNAHADHHHGSSDNRSASDLNQSRPSDRSFSEPSDSAEVSRIGTDFPEIGDRFRNGIPEIPQMATDHFPFESEENEGKNLVNIEEADDESEEEAEDLEEEDDEGEETEISAVGITDEVLAFSRNIAMHPETWLDFPLDPEDDLDDFDMSDAQRGHALAIERLAPRLAALRIELCPCHMSESYFWKVYFVLLHSRLHKRDAEILSSPQVMEARALWMKELQKQTKPETDWFGRNISSLKENSDIPEEDLTPSLSNYYAPPEFLSPRIYSFEPPSIMTQDYETGKHPYENTETQFIDKAIIEEEAGCKTEEKDLQVGPSPKAQTQSYDDDDDDDDWPEEEEASGFGGCVRVSVFMGNEEDVSFSDLEGDEDISILAIKSKMASKSTEPQTA